MSLTPLDRRAIRRSFDRAAPGYDRHAVLQREISDRLVERMEHFGPRPGRVLDLGCATGLSFEAIAERVPGAQVIGLDSSKAMLRSARSGKDRRVPYAVCADMTALPFAARSMGLVFSNLAAAWCDDLATLFAEVRRVLEPGGLFVFSTFGPDTLREVRNAWARVDDGVHVHRFMDMHDVGDRLVAAGFRDPVMDREDIAMDYPDPEALMDELRGAGWRNVATERGRGLTGRSRYQALLAACKSMGKEGRCRVGFEVLFGAALSPDTGQPVRSPRGEVATFPVESLRRRRGPS